MQYFIDHLTSILVVSVVLVILVVVQFRSSQSTAESMVTNVVYNDVMNMTQYLQRDIENMLTETQAIDARAEVPTRYSGTGVELCMGRDTTTAGIHATSHTVSFRFPTLEDWDNPLTSQVIEVEYNLVDTGRTVTLPSQDSTRTIPLFRLDRLVDGVWDGSSEEVMTSFRVEALNLGDPFNGFTPITSLCSTDLRKVRFEFKVALNGMEYSAGNQASTNQTNISRFGQTIHLSNWH